MKTAVIIGSQGQDGQLLWDKLVSQGYAVLGVGKDSVKTHQLAWDIGVDICSFNSVFELMFKLRPDEIYHLAAKHRSSEDSVEEDLNYYKQTFDINVYSLAHFLESVKLTQSGTKVFYASSSHIFGKPSESPQSESTGLAPESIYAITKVTGMQLCRLYRRSHEVFVSSGILYNHESHLRKDSFVSKKIIRSAIKIKQGLQDSLTLGSLTAEVDWGYAPDFVDAMWRILQLDYSDDFVIATGNRHTVQEFVEIAFGQLGLDWRKFVSQDKQVISRNEVARSGNNTKLKEATGWRPQVSFEEMVGLMLKAELKQENF
jgi:GDPmannose 4,6-dehydratase